MASSSPGGIRSSSVDASRAGHASGQWTLGVDERSEVAQPAHGSGPWARESWARVNQRSELARGAPQEAWSFINAMSASELDAFFCASESEWANNLATGTTICKLLLDWTKRSPYHNLIDDRHGASDVIEASEGAQSISRGAEKLLTMEKRAKAAYRDNKERFPPSIWHCCERFCFTAIAVDPEKFLLFEELKLIHDVAEKMHKDLKRLPEMVETRRRGIGGSYVGFVAPSRREREEVPLTERQRWLRQFRQMAVNVLPFLNGQDDAPSGKICPREKLCTNAICCLLDVSRKFLYGRKKTLTSIDASEQELSSIIDTAGTRLRQHRRVGDRDGYPAIQELPTYDCGCSEPCMGGLNIVYLTNEYKAFSKLSQELNPRRKENRYLLNVMFSPLSYSPTKVCDAALSALYTVSRSHISDVRVALETMCADPSIEHRAFLETGVEAYKGKRRHPMNRYPEQIREKIENHLDMVLRADPAGASGLNVCRVYSPEINTKEKLRRLLSKALDDDESVEEHLSESTLQRIVDGYLSARNCTIEFNQSDHNACPNCKTLNYAVLQFHFESKQLNKRYGDEYLFVPGPVERGLYEKSLALLRQVETKQFQEKEALRQLIEHNQRDAQIRKIVKSWSDHFRETENTYRRLNRSGFGWNSMADHAMVTHQDDMTKVDLPHFVVNASADITRWRFDVNAHVSAVTKEAVVFSHEQGTGAKNASAIIEMILLDHLIRCKGESIKIVVSDNAAVGKNWMTTVALPQYMVDQGLADIVVIVFLENNHGKWLADMLFGQWQTKRKRSTLLSVDDLLSEFESVRCKDGVVHGFAANPLSSVDFANVFERLGYQTKPPKDFGFTRRNIHFAAACRQTAKQRLCCDVEQIIGFALPDEEGMVRISSSPPTNRRQSELPYEERYFDVPAVSLQSSATNQALQSIDTSQDVVVPLVVPLDKPFSSSGQGVVSQRTAGHVGFNGFEFRKSKGYPELRNTSTRVVRQAWPSGLLQRCSISDTGEPVYGVESRKCAPENWVVRRPLKHFGASEHEWKARYPPRNVLNAKFSQGPREEHPWEPTVTYIEPPFPIIEGKAACEAMKNVASKHSEANQTVNVLDLLHAVFERMQDREGISDPWLQRRVTIPAPEALNRYRNELQTFVERGTGGPSAPMTVRQAFKKDESVENRVTQVLKRRGEDVSKKSLRSAVRTKLFYEASSSPGGLDRYFHAVEKDHERYAAELSIFKEKLRSFDAERGLLPTPTSDAGRSDKDL